jgi:hypothetical protein
MGRLAARMQRSADRRDERYRQHLEALRAGTAAPTLVERLTAPGQDAPGQDAGEADQRLFQKIGQVIQLLAAGPVSGPDGIPVLICLSEHASSRPPKLPLPKAWLQAIAAEPTLTGQVARIEMGSYSPGFVYAYAMSGPPVQLRRSFRDRRGWFTDDPLTYVLALAEDVRSRGVAALR